MQDLFWGDLKSDAPELANLALANLALAVTSYCPHSAGCESSWSSIAATHNKSGSSLGISKYEKTERIKMFYHARSNDRLKVAYQNLVLSPDLLVPVSIDFLEDGEVNVLEADTTR